MNTLDRRHFQTRTLAFAVILFTAGLIWFLYNVDVISGSGINLVLNLWPLALIALGADLLLQQSAPRLGLYIVLGLAFVVVVAAIFAPRLGIGVVATSTDTYNEPLDEAERAVINLYPGVGQLNIRAIEGTEAQDTLFNAVSTHLGDVTYSVHGTTDRRIELGQKQVNSAGWLGTDKDLRWDISLTDAIPLSLSVNTGVGDANLDFTGLTLDDLTLTGGVGSIYLSLPEQEATYQIDVNSGVGDLDLNIPDDSDVSVNLSGGVGDLSIDVSEGTPLQIRVSSGLGNVNLPTSLQRIDTGTGGELWQTSNYEGAERRVSISVQSGLGSLTIR